MSALAQSGHRLVRCTCPLLTQSGHRVRDRMQFPVTCLARYFFGEISLLEAVVSRRGEKERQLAGREQEGGTAMPEQVIRDAIDNITKVISARPDKARVKNASATASRINDLTFSVARPNGEAVHTDMPKAIGGGGGVRNRAGWCARRSPRTGTAIAMRAAKLRIAVEKLEVSVESESDNRGLLGLDQTISAALIGLRTIVRIRAANTTPGELESLVHWGDVHSPVACTLRSALAADIEMLVE